MVENRNHFNLLKKTSIIYFAEIVLKIFLKLGLLFVLLMKRSQVLYVELTAIKRGCAMAAPSSSIGITLVVVQKRHHTRFFPHKKDGDGRNNNVPAGTLVDTVITHPTEIDFYLVSHQSIQVCL